MRTRTVAVSVFLLGVSVALSASAQASVSASLVMKLYRFGLATSPTCENMAVYSVATPDFVDFTTNPTLGSSSVPPGTYHCVALELDSLLTVTPRSSGGCDPAPVNIDFCHALAEIKQSGARYSPTEPTAPDPTPGGGPQPANGDAGAAPPSSGATTIIDGVQPLGTDASHVFETCQAGLDHMVIYLSTQISQGARSNAFRPPSSPSDHVHGQPLGAPLVVGAHTTGTFLVGVNAVKNPGGGCFIDNPTFSFQSSESP